MYFNATSYTVRDADADMLPRVKNNFTENLRDFAIAFRDSTIYHFIICLMMLCDLPDWFFSAQRLQNRVQSILCFRRCVRFIVAKESIS